MSQSNHQKTQEQMLKERQLLRNAGIVAVAAAVVVALICVWSFVIPHAGNVSGVYVCDVMEDDSFHMELSFDAAAHTYAQTISEESAGSGSYTVRGSKLTTKNASGTKQTYTVYEGGDVIIPDDYLYDCTVADGDTFEAVGSRMGSDGSKTTMEFFADGTYTSTVVLNAGDASAESATVSHGNYVREGDVIRRVLITDDGKENTVPNLFVYEGRLCNYCFRR